MILDHAAGVIFKLKRFVHLNEKQTVAEFENKRVGFWDRARLASSQLI